MSKQMSPEALFYQSAASLHKDLIENRFSCVDVTEYFTRRIHVMNSKINAFLYIDEEDALKYAEHVEQLLDEGMCQKALLGVPIAVPDCVDMLRTPTTYGSLLLKDRVPAYEAMEVTLIKNAGAVIVGKTNTSEFSLSPDTVNLLRKPCLNPWNLDYSVGGPNGGAGACIAAGLSPFALVNDSCGGLRMTASFCRLVALLPTRGRIPHVRWHYMPLSERMFFRKGIAARSLQDVAMLLDVLSHHDGRDPLYCEKPHEHFSLSFCDRPKSLKIAFSQDLGFLPIDEDVQEATMEAARRLGDMGHVISEVKLSLNKNTLTHFANLFAADRYLMIAKELHNTSKIMELTKEWLHYGNQVTGVQYSLAETYMHWLSKEINHLFGEYDLLLTPVCPVAPFPVGQVPKNARGKPLHPLLGMWSFVCPFNMSGHPAMVLPCTNSAASLPIGFQLIGPEFGEKILLQLAAAYEEAHPWPTLFSSTST